MGVLIHPTLEKDTLFVERPNGLKNRLVDDVHYFWLMIIPEITATELYELDEDLPALWTMAFHLGGALKTHCNSAKINTAAIGNIVPQLHIHIVARHHDDAAWPQTIWGRGYMQPLGETTKAARLSTIQSWLGNM